MIGAAIDEGHGRGIARPRALHCLRTCIRARCGMLRRPSRAVPWGSPPNVYNVYSRYLLPDTCICTYLSGCLYLLQQPTAWGPCRPHRVRCCNTAMAMTCCARGAASLPPNIYIPRRELWVHGLGTRPALAAQRTSARPACSASGRRLGPCASSSTALDERAGVKRAQQPPTQPASLAVHMRAHWMLAPTATEQACLMRPCCSCGCCAAATAAAATTRPAGVWAWRCASPA